MKLFKISISSRNFHDFVYRYGKYEDEVIERLRKEYRRYGKKKADFEMIAEEVEDYFKK